MTVGSEEKDKGGRPPIWTDPIAFSEAVDKYFENKEETHTWTGLALHLGFESRQSLQEYKDKDGFCYPIKKALARIEAIYEQRMVKSNNPSGSIFALKNFGWTDRQEIKHEGNVIGFLSVDPLADDQTNDSPSKDSGAKEA